MKKLKLNASTENAEVLSRDQLKKVFGGLLDGYGDCQAEGSSCDTQRAINCCSGLKCAEYICRVATV